ncbi:hypothetical protein [Nocardia sp. NPDC003354]
MTQAMTGPRVTVCEKVPSGVEVYTDTAVTISEEKPRLSAAMRRLRLLIFFAVSIP